MPDIDYLFIGHICIDLTDQGPALGGTASFGALAARALGMRPGILTSAPDSILPLLQPLDGIAIWRIDAPEATTFRNVYGSSGRVQTLHGRALPLSPHHLPKAWRDTPIVQLAPIADEVSPDLAACFPQSIVGVTPQGWMRAWDAQGRVRFKPWQKAKSVLPRVDAAVMSIEDIQGDESLVEQYSRLARLLVITRGLSGASLIQHGQTEHIHAPSVQEIDPTGAGDIFATAFLAALWRFGNPLRAAHFATLLASDSVTRRGVDSLPQTATIEAAWRMA